MVVLIAFLQSTQDADGTQLVGLVDHDGLEAALQGLVLLEVLLVLVQRRGTDGTQLATCQCRLQDVGGIHGPLTATGTHQCVYLVDEQDNTPIGFRHLVDDALQALLELTLVLGTSYQGTHVKRVELLVLQVFRHVATYDTSRQSFDDGRLTRTGFTDEYRVVLRAAAQDLQHTTNLIVTANDGVELTMTGQLHQVLGVLLQRLVVVVGTLRLHLLPLSQFLDGTAQVLLRDTGILHDAACRGTVSQQGQQQRLHADELVALLLGIVLCFQQHLIRVARQIRLSATDAWQVLQLALYEHVNLLAVHA